MLEQEGGAEHPTKEQVGKRIDWTCRNEGIYMSTLCGGNRTDGWTNGRTERLIVYCNDSIGSDGLGAGGRKWLCFTNVIGLIGLDFFSRLVLVLRRVSAMDNMNDIRQIMP